MSELGKGFHAGFAASVKNLDDSGRGLVHPEFEYFSRTRDNLKMSLFLSQFPQRLMCALAVAVLAGCGTEPAKPVKPVAVEAPKPITGRSAFYRMFPAARQWAADAQGIQLRSIHLEEVQGAPGTAGAWQAMFVSASLHQSKTFTWSAIDAPGNLKQGVFPGDKGDFNGKIEQALPFFNQALHIDSDEAFKSLNVPAVKGEPINFLLEFTSRFPDLTWRVMWGESVGSASKSGFVDATTGQVVDKVR